MTSMQRDKIRMIGVGELGSLVADELQKYPEYRAYKIVATTTQNNTFSLGVWDSMQEYEENFPTDEVAFYLESVREGEEILVVTEGGIPVSGCLLRLLHLVKDCKITLLYIKPSTSLVSTEISRNTEFSFGVLQEYARSGLLERMLFVEKSSIEDLVGDVPINLYERRAAEIIAYMVGMLYYFENSDAVVASGTERPVGCRLGTLALSSLDSDSGPTSLMFDLKTPRSIEFFYGIPQSEIDSNSGLMRQITAHIEDCVSCFTPPPSMSYEVISLDAEEPYLLGVYYVSSPVPLRS